MFDKHLFQCAEYATIAQLYLQSVGVDSEYVGGEYIGNKNWEFGDQHSFVIIHENDIDYVFDPANNNAYAKPNISIVEMTPEQKIKIQAKLLAGKRKVAFFETRDIITNRKTFYGYGDGCNILEDMVFEKEQTTPNTFVKDLSATSFKISLFFKSTSEVLIGIFQFSKSLFLIRKEIGAPVVLENLIPDKTSIVSVSICIRPPRPLPC